MKFWLKHSLLLLGLIAFCSMEGQMSTIHLKNPSFEGLPRAGLLEYPGISAPGWIDCGGTNFPGETPPDIHPGVTRPFFNVVKPPQDGETYIGLVARENESWESVSQLLDAPLRTGNCYSISVHLARSANYVSGQNLGADVIAKSQSRPLVLRIYGGLRPCGKKQLLAESPLIEHTDWRKYDVEFEVKSDLYYITFEAFYRTPVLLPYNGNILLDNISPIQQINCPDDEAIAEEVFLEKPPKREPEPEVDDRQVKTKKVVEEVVLEKPTKKEPEPEVFLKKEKKITEELNAELTKGQTIKINNLYFEADTSSIQEDSYAALEEVYDFLSENPNIRIEIGGHTNGIPKHDYCDKLSTARAKSVAEYLVQKGIEQERLEFKGYGKRKPIASNKSKEGRRRNQRVEITILNVN